jgi:hypothetical protein
MHSKVACIFIRTFMHLTLPPQTRSYKPPPAGSNLALSIAENSKSGFLPAIVERCIEAVDSRGLTQQGIYREVRLVGIEYIVEKSVF